MERSDGWLGYADQWNRSDTFVRPWTLVEDITWDWQCIGCIVVVIIFGTVMSFSCYMEGVRLIGGS